MTAWMSWRNARRLRGPLKISLRGPWTLAVTIELPRTPNPDGIAVSQMVAGTRRINGFGLWRSRPIGSRIDNLAGSSHTNRLIFGIRPSIIQESLARLIHRALSSASGAARSGDLRFLAETSLRQSGRRQNA